MRIDLHVHSAVSDGTDTPTSLVGKARDAGLDVIALTDHDTFDGLPEANAAGRRWGVKILPGLEFSTRYNQASVHLLGYGCDPYDRPLLAELAKIRAGRTGRLQAMLDKLGELGMPLTAEEVWRQAGSAPSLGRPHVADAMVAKGYVADRDEAFASYLADDGPAFVDRYATPLPEAIRLVHQAKGVAVVAHPWSRGTEDVLTAEVLTALAAGGLEGIEVDHPDHDERQRELLTELGYRLGLVRTGSSDYHGTGKTNNPLGACTTRPTAYRDLLRKIAARGSVLPA